MSSNTLPKGRVLRPAQLAEYLSIGLSTVWLRCKDKDLKDFPTPFRISKRTTVFYQSDADRYLANCAALFVKSTDGSAE